MIIKEPKEIIEEVIFVPAIEPSNEEGFLGEETVAACLKAAYFYKRSFELNVCRERKIWNASIVVVAGTFDDGRGQKTDLMVNELRKHLLDVTPILNLPSSDSDLETEVKKLAAFVASTHPEVSKITIVTPNRLFPKTRGLLRSDLRKAGIRGVELLQEPSDSKTGSLLGQKIAHLYWWLRSMFPRLGYQ